ncbi:MAG: hypothetical protein JHC26_01360 [Thermofilum sp.]|jgi:hypothetical protein|uniref:hypothetical protein n=1 Tax=Thermofilum sp. TaxID=1961369 RepID=UPI00258BA349|nr:hypothetical protein [Thermofilum sp.]MCI4407708.1 hypothetical protein [Thermofilum sp.]
MAVAVKHKTLTPQREKFKHAVTVCKEKVRHLPKGEKRRAYIECMREHLRK